MSQSAIQLFDYEDVLLLPRKCMVESRSECDTSVALGKRKFKLPIVPANMRAVVNEEICEMLARQGYFYIMHRFDVDNVKFVKRMKAQDLVVSISVGVKKEDHQLVLNLAAEKLEPDYITIDIAHGHAESVRVMIQHIKTHLPNTFVIAGNVGTPEGVMELENWGADCVKLGIGPGKVCITKLKTGFGTGGWQLSAVKWCCSVAKKPVIADGGIKVHGDIAKAFRFGARFVMCGNLFAGHIESPGKIIEANGQSYKEYYGSASSENKGERKHVEGKAILTPLKGKLLDTLTELTEDLQSAISYGGGTVVEDLRKCNYVILGGVNLREHLFLQDSKLNHSAQTENAENAPTAPTAATLDA